LPARQQTTTKQAVATQRFYPKSKEPRGQLPFFPAKASGRELQRHSPLHQVITIDMQKLPKANLPHTGATPFHACFFLFLHLRRSQGLMQHSEPGDTGTKQLQLKCGFTHVASLVE
jgi:hypothetical protein